jgi:hypothetical protein
VAGLLVLPGRLLGPDQAVHVSVPPTPAGKSVQAVPPVPIRHRHVPRAKAKASAPSRSSAQGLTYVARPRTVVRVSPARRLLKAHRSAVISQLAPTAPLVRARLLAAVAAPRPLASPKPSSTAKTIALLAAGLGKK